MQVSRLSLKSLNGCHVGTVALLTVTVSIVMAEPVEPPPMSVEVSVLYECSSAQFTNHLNVHLLISGLQRPEKQAQKELLLSFYK